jgi:hypothetical protein
MSIRFVLPLPVIALSFGVVRLAAQADPAEWAADCRRYDRDHRPRVCLVREAGMPPAGGTLTVDPGRNGGVAVYGWDRDSIAVTAKIQATGRTEEAAQRLADGIRIEAAGRAIRAVGPDAGFREHWSVTFDVCVPRHTDLSLETVNGPLSVEDVSGTMDLRALNGRYRSAAFRVT